VDLLALVILKEIKRKNECTVYVLVKLMTFLCNLSWSFLLLLQNNFVVAVNTRDDKTPGISFFSEKDFDT
jgi:hypothetical protein